MGSVTSRAPSVGLPRCRCCEIVGDGTCCCVSPMVVGRRCSRSSAESRAERYIGGGCVEEPSPGRCRYGRAVFLRGVLGAKGVLGPASTRNDATRVGSRRRASRGGEL